MVGLREKQKAGRRDAIVEAALQLFEQNGYEETTIQRIADRAELTVTTVYRYFRSKADFLVELNNRLEDESSVTASGC